MRQMVTWRKKSFREWLLNLCGYEIWPPTHNDPTIKGPPPRIISKRQRKAMEMMWRGQGDGGVVIGVYNDSVMKMKGKGNDEH